MVQRSRAGKAGAAVAAALAFGLVLAGCAGGGAGTGDDGADNSLQDILDRGTIKIGLCLSAPQWGLINSEGEPDGFDTDVAKGIAEHLGVELEVVESTNASRVPSLQSGTVDLISCTFTNTEERRAQVDFSDPVVHTGNSLLVPNDSDIDSVEDLAGRTVAVSKGGTSIPVTTAAAPEAKQQAYETWAAALLAVQQGQADAAIDTSSVVSTAADSDPELRIAVDGAVGPVASFAIGVAQGKPALLEAVNEFLADFHANKEGTALYERWYETAPTYQFEGIE